MRFLMQARHSAGNRGRMLVVGGITMVLSALVFAPAAPASSHNLPGEFAPFGECPLDRETITDCIYSVTEEGSVTIGSKTVPIENPVTLQGGFEGAGSEVKFFGAENGDTLSKTPQPVPGGLVGVTAPKWWPKFLQNWFNEGIENGLTGVNAIVELAAPATSIALSTENLAIEEGTALGLPAKVRLENALLGNNCYIGSNAKPIQINLTTGPSGAVSGTFGELVFNNEFTIFTITGGRLVDGTFTVPAASGCGGLFALFVDPLVNSILGTPSASGKNTAILEGVLKDAQVPAIREIE
jgi:hypothetical protein